MRQAVAPRTAAAAAAGNAAAVAAGNAAAAEAGHAAAGVTAPVGPPGRSNVREQAWEIRVLGLEVHLERERTAAIPSLRCLGEEAVRLCF